MAMQVVRLKKAHAALLITISLLVSISYGQTAGSNKVQMPVGQSLVKKKAQKTNEDLAVTVITQAQAHNYSSNSPIDNGSTQQIEAQLKLKTQGQFFTALDLTLGSFATEQSFYYALPEAYIGYGSKNSSVTFGRKLENLSFSDSYYNTGLIQGFMTNDLINYSEGGLTGLAAHFNNDSFGFNVGYNPIFIPNQGPQATAKDGKIVSGNRWAPSPPEQFKFGDQNQEIIYAITDFKITDIISHSGLYANIHLGANQERPLLNATYANKPINELALSRETFADISTFKGNVILTPVVLNHDVYSVDFNLDAGNFKSTLSYLGDQPQNIPAENSMTMQNLAPISMTGIYAAYNLTDVVGQKLEIYASMAQFNGGQIKDINSNGQESSFAFASSRTRFSKPIKFGVKGDMLFINDKPLQATADLTYDQDYRGSLLSATLHYAPIKDLRLSLGADVIGVEVESTSKQTNFLDQNKANDRFTAGAIYAF